MMLVLAMAQLDEVEDGRKGRSLCQRRVKQGM